MIDFLKEQIEEVQKDKEDQEEEIQSLLVQTTPRRTNRTPDSARHGWEASNC